MKIASLMVVFLIPAFAWGAVDQCDTVAVLSKIRPGAAWVLKGNSMKDLTWLDKKQSKPTASEIDKAKQLCVSDSKDREAKKAQARIEVKNPNAPVEKKVESLILLLDLDR